MNPSSPAARQALVLVLYCSSPLTQMRPAIRHHLHVLSNSAAKHQVLYVNVLEGIPYVLSQVPFDVVILHTTLLCWRWASNAAEFLASLLWLQNSPALKIALPQDEYDHSAVLDEWMQALRVSVIFTNFDAASRALLYPRMHNQATFLECLTGYIDPATVETFSQNAPPMKDRPLDIVYRAAHLPYWFGSQGQLKHRLASIIRTRAQELGFNVDISTGPATTITSDYWFQFLASSKTVAGCESGSSTHDPRGRLRQQIQALLQETPELSFEELDKHLPAGWDDHRFFAVGPRHLEAIITRTCQILVAGSYNNILIPDRHYIPIKRDFSNLDEVLAKIKDLSLLEATANRAYEEIVLSGAHSYRSFAQQLESAFPQRPPSHFPFTLRVIHSLIYCNRKSRDWLDQGQTLMFRLRRKSRGVGSSLSRLAKKIAG